MRAIQRTQFRAKIEINDLNPTNLLKRNFYFEMEGVSLIPYGLYIIFMNHY